MNKKVLKIVNVLLIVLVLISIASNVLAAPFEPSSMTGDPSIGTGKIQNVGNDIVGILQTVGIVISVIILIVLGIKYMMGSAEEKAEYKKTMLPYIIGAALVFAASAFAQIVYDFATGIKVA